MRLASLIPALALLGSMAAAAPPPKSAADFDTLRRQADAAREADDLPRAARLYRQALALRPNWPDGWWALGTIHYDTEQFALAAEDFAKLVASDPKNGEGRAMLGLCQFELGQDARALENIIAARAIGMHQNDDLRHVVYYHQAILLLRQRKFSSAQDVLTQLGRDGVQEDSAAVAMGMAVLLVPPDQLPSEGTPAKSVIRQAGLAELRAAAHHADAGREIYTTLSQQAATFPNLHYAYGRFLLAYFQEEDEAIAQFEQEIRSNPKHVQAHLEVAAVHYRVDSAAGVPFAERAVALDPSLPFGHYLLGVLYADTGQPERAIPELELSRKSFANAPEVYFALAAAYTKVGRKEDAAKARAEFLRTTAAATKNTGPTAYGDQKPLGLKPEAGQEAKPAVPRR